MSLHLTAETIRGFDELPSGPRRDALSHAAVCRACRDALLVEDPTRGFAFLSLEPIPDRRFDELSRRLELDLDRLPDQAARPSGWSRWGAIAAGLVLAGLLSIYLGSGSVLEQPSDGTLPAVFTTQALEWPDPVDEGEYQGIELLSSPGSAQVLDLTVGETQVVMIFDKELEI